MSLVPTVSCLFFAKIKNHLAENVNFERNINSSIESPEMSCMIHDTNTPDNTRLSLW